VGQSPGLAAAGVPGNWVVDATDDSRVVITELRIGKGGDYEIAGSTDKSFTRDVPYRVTIDLPALSERRTALLRRAPPTELTDDRVGLDAWRCMCVAWCCPRAKSGISGWLGTG
jgi:hypothetical protein